MSSQIENKFTKYFHMEIGQIRNFFQTIKATYIFMDIYYIVLFLIIK